MNFNQTAFVACTTDTRGSSISGIVAGSAEPNWHMLHRHT